MDTVVLNVHPGVCGFTCQVRAERIARHGVKLRIDGSECRQIRRLRDNLPEMTVAELFVPFTRNPLFKAAEKAGCHLSCPVPTALIKAAEVALELALAKEVRLDFCTKKEEDTNEKC